MLTAGPVPKRWPGCSYMGSEDYELGQKFDDISFQKIRPHIQK